MKVKEWLRENHRELSLPEKHDGDDIRAGQAFLDAEVIGLPCKTCGGLRIAPTKPDGSGCQVCPDCADTPVYVIAPEAWEAFVCACAELPEDIRSKADACTWHYGDDGKAPSACIFDDWWELCEDNAHCALQALLPGARVAEKVVSGVPLTSSNHANDPVWLASLSWRNPDGPGGQERWCIHDDHPLLIANKGIDPANVIDIAVLIKQEEVEGADDTETSAG